MTRISAAISNDQSIYAALELSKNSWLLAIQVPDRDNPSLHPIKGGDTEGLMAKLDAARDRVAKVTGQTPKLTLCYEAGYDGFWLARLLEQRGMSKGEVGSRVCNVCSTPRNGHSVACLALPRCAISSHTAHRILHIDSLITGR